MAATGVDKDNEIIALEDKIKNLQNNIRGSLQTLSRYKELRANGRFNVIQMQEFPKVKESYDQAVLQRDALESQLAKLKRQQREAGEENSCIECKGRVHTNTKIHFGNLQMMVEKSFSNSKVEVDGNGINIKPLY